MKFNKVSRSISIGSSVIEIRRTENGVIEIQAEDAFALQKGLGYAHAHDRLMQMLITRILAEGKVTEYLFDSEEAFAFDLLIRKQGFSQDVVNDLTNLSEESRRWCEAYCEGVNTYLNAFGLPFIGKVLRLKATPWSVEDTMRLIKMHMYLGLAQLQERVERFIIQAIHDGVSIDRLKKLFSPGLDDLDEECIDLIRRLHLDRPYLDVQMQFTPGLSNNWAVGGWRSLTGAPLCANDPHLQINRLPAIWYEVILKTSKTFQMGITSPGFPGLVMGRTECLSVSFTYGMMDTVDFFIEEIKQGECRREEKWEPLTIREEVFRRKKKGKLTLYFLETQTGVIERKELSTPTIADGLYLSLGWSSAKQGASPNLNALVNLWSLKSIEEAGECLREITLSCNWVLADSKGNIAFQQSGRLPERSHSGLYPLPGWKNENLWKGFYDASSLFSEYNPAKGYVASANDDKNQEGYPRSISVPFASYRYDRICRFLSQEKKFSIDDMKQLQTDLYSIQAEKFLEQLLPLIPETPIGEILKNWDCRYTKDSRGATLFEIFYLEILQEIFGKVFGESAWNRLANNHSLLVFTHGHFDRILLYGDESWFGSEGKENCLRRVLEKILRRFSAENVPLWEEKNRFKMTNFLFDGKLPKFLGFDRGPFSMEGSRATVTGSQIFRERKRVIATASSYRFVTDLSKPEAFTILAGGVSEKRFSKYYTSDVKKWLDFDYKKIRV